MLILGILAMFYPSVYNTLNGRELTLSSCNLPPVISERESMELQTEWFDLLENVLVQDPVNIKILQQVFFPICGSSPHSVSVKYHIHRTIRIERWNWHDIHFNMIVTLGWSGSSLYTIFNQTILEYWLSFTMMNGFSGRDWPARLLTPLYCSNKNSIEIVLKVNTTLPHGAAFNNALMLVTSRVSSLLLMSLSQ